MDENGEREGQAGDLGATGPLGLAGIGQLLRRTRESKGISLAQAQVDTKIRTKYLEAIEAGDDRQTPGEAYFKGFLRFYGNYLGLDGTSLVARYKEIRAAEAGSGQEAATGRTEPRQRSRREKGPSSARPARPKRERKNVRQPGLVGDKGELRRRSQRKRSPVAVIVIVALIAGGLGYAGFRYFEHLRDNRPSTGVDGQPGPTAGEGTDGGSGPVTPVTPDFSKMVVDSRQIDSETTTYTLDLTELRVALKVNERCWIRAVVDGQMTEETLEVGQEREWAAGDRFELRMGNPGGVSLTVNSAPVDTGPREQPPRTIILTLKK